MVIKRFIFVIKKWYVVKVVIKGFEYGENSCLLMFLVCFVFLFENWG